MFRSHTVRERTSRREPKSVPRKQCSREIFEDQMCLRTFNSHLLLVGRSIQSSAFSHFFLKSLIKSGLLTEGLGLSKYL